MTFSETLSLVVECLTIEIQYHHPDLFGPDREFLPRLIKMIRPYRFSHKDISTRPGKVPFELQLYEHDVVESYVAFNRFVPRIAPVTWKRWMRFCTQSLNDTPIYTMEIEARRIRQKSPCHRCGSDRQEDSPPCSCAVILSGNSWL